MLNGLCGFPYGFLYDIRGAFCFYQNFSCERIHRQVQRTPAGQDGADAGGRYGAWKGNAPQPGPHGTLYMRNVRQATQARFAWIRLRCFLCLCFSRQEAEQHRSFWLAGSKNSLHVQHSRLWTIRSPSARRRSIPALQTCPISSARLASASIHERRNSSASSCLPAALRDRSSSSHGLGVVLSLISTPPAFPVETA